MFVQFSEWNMSYESNLRLICAFASLSFGIVSIKISVTLYSTLTLYSKVSLLKTMLPLFSFKLFNDVSGLASRVTKIRQFFFSPFSAVTSKSKDLLLSSTGNKKDNTADEKVTSFSIIGNADSEVSSQYYTQVNTN